MKEACKKCGGSGFKRVGILVEYTGGDKFSHKAETRISLEEYNRLEKIVDGVKQRVYTGTVKCECSKGSAS